MDQIVGSTAAYHNNFPDQTACRNAAVTYTGQTHWKLCDFHFPKNKNDKVVVCNSWHVPAWRRTRTQNYVVFKQNKQP
jgi:hypothetical protein